MRGSSEVRAELCQLGGRGQDEGMAQAAQPRKRISAPGMGASSLAPRCQLSDRLSSETEHTKGSSYTAPCMPEKYVKFSLSGAVVSITSDVGAQR